MSCHCSSKCGLLGTLEQKIMEVLWNSPKPLKPAEVKAKISDDFAYTTIMTVLKRLSDKKILKRTPSGNTFLYQPLSDKKSYACSCLDDLFSRLISSYGQEAVTSFKKIAGNHGHKL